MRTHIKGITLDIHNVNATDNMAEENKATTNCLFAHALVSFLPNDTALVVF